MFPNAYFPKVMFAQQYFPPEDGGPAPPGTGEFRVGGPYVHSAFPISGREAEDGLMRSTNFPTVLQSGEKKMSKSKGHGHKPVMKETPGHSFPKEFGFCGGSNVRVRAHFRAGGQVKKFNTGGPVSDGGYENWATDYQAGDRADRVRDRPAGNPTTPPVQQQSFHIDSNKTTPRVQQSFRDAFAAARKAQGAGGTFTWNGKSYTTGNSRNAPMDSEHAAAQNELAGGAYAKGGRVAPLTRIKKGGVPAPGRKPVIGG